MGGDESVGERLARGEPPNKVWIVVLGVVAAQVLMVVAVWFASSTRTWSGALAILFLSLVGAAVVGALMRMASSSTVRSLGMGLLIAVPLLIFTGPTIGMAACNAFIR